MRYNSRYKSKFHDWTWVGKFLKVSCFQTLKSVSIESYLVLFFQQKFNPKAHTMTALLYILELTFISEKCIFDVRFFLANFFWLDSFSTHFQYNSSQYDSVNLERMCRSSEFWSSTGKTIETRFYKVSDKNVRENHLYTVEYGIPLNTYYKQLKWCFKRLIIALTLKIVGHQKEPLFRRF